MPAATPLLLQEFYTSTQQSSAASTTSSSTAAKRGSTSTSSSPLDKKHTLLATADVLLTCAVQGGLMAGSASTQVAASASAKIQTAAARCGLPVPQESVAGAVAPPINDKEAVQWLKLSANALKAAGWKLQAGQLLLTMGPDLDRGSFRRSARRLLMYECEDREAVAKVLEAVARQELGRDSGTDSNVEAVPGEAAAADADTDSDAEADADAAGSPVVPRGFSQGFLFASKLLLDAYKIHLAHRKYDKCRRMLQQYEGLESLLDKREVDEVTLVGLFCGGATCCAMLCQLHSCYAVQQFCAIWGCHNSTAQHCAAFVSLQHMHCTAPWCIKLHMFLTVYQIGS
jgi:hypothetical protein